MEFEQAKVVILISIIFVVLVTSLFLWIGYNAIRKNYVLRQEKDLIDKKHQKELLKESIRITEVTQKQIAMELHDQMGATLSIAFHHLESLKDLKNLETEDRLSLQKVSEAIDQSVLSVRTLSRALASKTLEDFGLLEAIQELADYSSIKGVNLILQHNNGSSFLNSRQELGIYRIAQESINNALKYSKCSTIRVHLELDGENYSLSVIDDGIGFQWNEYRKSLGLSNMQIRAEELGASLKIESEPEKGTKIILTSHGQYQSHNS